MRHRVPPPAPFNPAAAQAKRAPPVARWSGKSLGRTIAPPAAPPAMPPPPPFMQAWPGARALQRAAPNASGDTKSSSSSNPAKKPASAPPPSTDVKDPAPATDTKDVKSDAAGSAPSLTYQQRKKLLQQKCAPILAEIAENPARIVVFTSAGNHYKEAEEGSHHPGDKEQLVDCVCWHLSNGNFEASADLKGDVTVTIQLDLDARNPKDKKNWRIAAKLDKNGKLYVRHCGPGG